MIGSLNLAGESGNSKAMDAKNIQKVNQEAHLASSFDFSMTTSGGDKLEFSFKNSAYSKSSSNSTEYGRSFEYKMKYEGDGLSDTEKEEISKTMDAIAPMLGEYFENAKNAENKMEKSFLQNTVQMVRNEIMPIKTDENLEYLKNQVSKEIDKAMIGFEPTKDLFENATKLFEKLFENDSSESFLMYA